MWYIEWVKEILLSFLFLINLAEGDQIPVLNQYVLNAVKSMPRGGGYEASQRAVNRLAASVTVKEGKVHQDIKGVGASFCSGATYLVFLRVIEDLRASGSLKLSAQSLARFADLNQEDGEGVFGRWNANGPGTAKLFRELRCGSNFTSYEKALPGDFMKIWWTDEIGGKERGHLVVYLGMEGGQVKFWSSNQPGGYGVKRVPKSKVRRVLFSRLEHHQRLNSAAKLSPKNQFLADMLRKRFTWRQVVKECRVSER